MSLEDSTHFLMATFSRRLLAKLLQQGSLEDVVEQEIHIMDLPSINVQHLLSCKND